MPCNHKIRFGTIAEADGGHDSADGSTIIDATCETCGRSGSMRVTPADIQWGDEEPGQ